MYRWGFRVGRLGVVFEIYPLVWALEYKTVAPLHVLYLGPFCFKWAWG